MNPLLMKATNKEDMLRENIKIIFELIIYVQYPGQKKTVQVSCGFC